MFGLKPDATICAADPGKSVIYCAAFDRGRLAAIHAQAPGEPYKNWDFYSPPSGWFDAIIVEKPMLYPGHPRPNDILDLACSAFLFAGRFAEYHDCAAFYPERPSAWKGQRDKIPHHLQLIRKVLTVLELEVLLERYPDLENYVLTKAAQLGLSGAKPAYDAEFTNFLDAVALGCTALGRMQTAGIENPAKLKSRIKSAKAQLKKGKL